MFKQVIGSAVDKASPYVIKIIKGADCYDRKEFVDYMDHPD